MIIIRCSCVPRFQFFSSSSGRNSRVRHTRLTRTHHTIVRVLRMISSHGWGGETVYIYRSMYVCSFAPGDRRHLDGQYCAQIKRHFQFIRGIKGIALTTDLPPSLQVATPLATVPALEKTISRHVRAQTTLRPTKRALAEEQPQALPLTC